MTRLALCAPEDDGLFPSVLTCPVEGWAHARWTSSDRRPPSASERACHVVDAAFTCRMLLAWHALTGEPRALARARRFADRLVRLQRPSGAFPGWVEPDGRVPAELAESAETAVGVTLLFELSAAVPDAPPVWLRAALGGLRFLDGSWRPGAGGLRDVLLLRAVGRAGAHWPPRRPERRPQAEHALHRLVRRGDALRAARDGRAEAPLPPRRCVDELSLHQAVWSPPWLPAPAHGGFGVMNADSEWNDARQSLFAPLYLDSTARRAPPSSSSAA